MPYTFAPENQRRDVCGRCSKSFHRVNTGKPRNLTQTTQTSYKTDYMQEDTKTIADLITANIISTTKEVLTSQEAAKYMGISMSYLYKLTMRAKIPHYKPLGKMCYFNRQELETWLQSNRVSTDAELSQRANAYCMATKGGGR